MYDEPKISVIRLVTVPFEIDDKNQLTFSNLQAQTTYFSNLPGVILEDSTYQRKDNIIRYPGIIDDIYQYNYVMYQNTNYNDKWFYAYITSMRYISDSMTEIQIKTDVYQTWFNDIQIKQSFVEREHVNDDTIGKNLVPENLETGEFIPQSKEDSTTSMGHVMVAVTYDIFGNRQGGSSMGGISQGTSYYLIGGDVRPGHEDDPSDLFGIQYLIAQYAQSNVTTTDAITSMFIVPDTLTGYSSIDWDYMRNEGGLAYYPYKYISRIDDIDLEEFTITKNYTTIDGYTPKNNKLFIRDYNYILLDNNSGNSAIYSYENFKDTSCKFDIKGVVTPGCSIRAIPKNYNITGNNNSEGLNAGKYPICNWNSDVYTNWLTQNGVNIGVSIASSLVTIAGGVALSATGAGAVAGVSSAVSGGLSIAQTLGQIHEYSMQPPQIRGNTNSGDVTFSSGNIKFTAYKMSIKNQFARIIDNYFSMFGYKVNELKIPNITGRRNWNYVKTIDVNVIGAIPQDDLQEIKSIFNKGVTFWHNASTFLDYSQNNDII